MKKTFFIFWVIFCNCVAYAEFEISIAPWPPMFSESKYGAAARADVEAGYFINENIQLNAGVILGTRTQGTSERLAGGYAGVLYNFSSDHTRSFVAGGGVGYVNHYPLVLYDPGDPSSQFVYLRAGKRILLSEDYKITYFPYVQVIEAARSGDEKLSGEIKIFNFSVLF